MRDCPQRLVEHLDVDLGETEEILDAAFAVHRVPAHGQIRCVDLQQDPVRRDRLVLGAHRRRERRQVVALARVEVVRLEQRDHPGRGRVHERLGGAR